MPDPTIPTPQDSNLLLQDTTTKTASFNSTALDLGAGFAPGGLGKPAAAVVQVTALDVSSGDETYKFTLQQSADNVSFTAAGADVTVTATGAALAKGHVTQRYVRLALTASGTTPSVTYKAWLNPLP
jgi:hypothetical protein